MKRLIAAGVILAVMAALCVTGLLVVREAGRAVGGPLTEALDAAAEGDAPAARAAALRAEAAVVAREGRLSCFVHHNLVEDLGARLAALPGLATPDTLADFAAEAEAARVMLTHVVKDETPSLSHIL